MKKYFAIFVCSALILSVLPVFWQVSNYDFIIYDDGSYVYQNPHVLTGLTKDNLIWAFTSCFFGYWQPLTWLSLMMNSQLFGPGPAGFHLVNVFLHLANTLLLFAVLKKMTGKIWQSAFVAMLFAIHPMHVESVAWIAERKDVLSAFFLLLTLLVYTSYVKKPTIFRYITSLVLFAFGLMSKPMLVTIPFILLLLDYWPLNRFSISNRQSAIGNWQSKTQFSILNLLFEKVPFFIIAGVSCAVTFLTQKAGSIIYDTKTVPLADRVGNTFLSYAKYIYKLFWPTNLAIFYPYDVGSYVSWQVRVSIVLLIVISVLVIHFGRNHKFLPAGWFWFMGTLVPVIGLVQFTGSSYADRFTYIPYIGLFIMLAWGLPGLLSGWHYRKIVLGVAASITFIALGTVAYRQVGFWKDSITLFSHAIEVTRNNAVANDELGNAYLVLGRYQDAANTYKRAIEIKPDSAKAYNNLGTACLSMGRYQDAVEAYKQAIKIKPDYIGTYNNLGAAYLNLGDYKEALEYCRQAIKLKPDFAQAYYNIGAVCDKLGQWQDSIEAYKQAVKFKPDYADAFNNLGIASLNMGSSKESIDFFKKAVGIRPDWAEAHYNLGVAFLINGDKISAGQEYKILKNLGVKQADQLYDLINR